MPMDLITFEDYSEFTKEEAQLRKLLLDTPEVNTTPSLAVINNIIGYSKALSVRETNLLGAQEFILN